MQQKSAIIIDDEPQSRSFLCHTLQQQCSDIFVAGEAATVVEGLAKISSHHPDIVFLDIQMQGETGFDLLKQLQHIDFALIFTTAFDNYAITAFRFNAIDYLLKPIITEELIEAVNKIKQRNYSGQPVIKQQVNQLYQDIKTPQMKPEKIAVPTSDGFVFIPITSIVYCLAKSNYTEFHLSDNKTVLSSYTLKQYDELLTPQSFFRVHRSYLINLNHVKAYKRGDGGEIVMNNGDIIELSRTHKDEFLHLLNIRW